MLFIELFAFGFGIIKRISLRAAYFREELSLRVVQIVYYNALPLLVELDFQSIIFLDIECSFLYLSYIFDPFTATVNIKIVAISHFS